MKECTLRDIAGELGVSPASIVVHFKTKTALFEEVLSADIRMLYGMDEASRDIGVRHWGQALHSRILRVRACKSGWDSLKKIWL